MSIMKTVNLSHAGSHMQAPTFNNKIPQYPSTKKQEKGKEKTKKIDGKKQKEMQSKSATRIDVRSIMGTSTEGKSSTCL